MLQRFEHGNMVEIRDRIMFDFYLGLPHVIIVVYVAAGFQTFDRFINCSTGL